MNVLETVPGVSSSDFLIGSRLMERYEQASKLVHAARTLPDNNISSVLYSPQRSGSGVHQTIEHVCDSWDIRGYPGPGTFARSSFNAAFSLVSQTGILPTNYDRLEDSLLEMHGPSFDIDAFSKACWSGIWDHSLALGALFSNVRSLVADKYAVPYGKPRIVVSAAVALPYHLALHTCLQDSLSELEAIQTPDSLASAIESGRANASTAIEQSALTRQAMRAWVQSGAVELPKIIVSE